MWADVLSMWEVGGTSFPGRNVDQRGGNVSGFVSRSFWLEWGWWWFSLGTSWTYQEEKWRGERDHSLLWSHLLWSGLWHQASGFWKVLWIFRCLMYPILPSSALVHLAFLAWTLPFGTPVVSFSVVPTDSLNVFCAGWVLNTCWLNLHVRVLAYDLQSYLWSPWSVVS